MTEKTRVWVYYGPTSGQILLVGEGGGDEVIGTRFFRCSHLRAARKMHRICKQLCKMGYDAKIW